MTAILKVKDGNGNVIPIQAIKGEKGEKGDRGLPGSGGVPDGGTTGQVLTKNSNADGDAGWKDTEHDLFNANGKTYEEVIYAYESGKVCYLTYAGTKLLNNGYSGNRNPFKFSGENSNGEILTATLSYDNTLTFGDRGDYQITTASQTLSKEKQSQALANIGGLSKNQGTANSGKFLGIGADGVVVPTEVGGSGGSDRLIAKYVHSGNPVIQPTALDLTTGVFTCAGHGLTTGDTVMVIPDGSFATIPFELCSTLLQSTAKLTVGVIDANTFTLRNGSTDITYPNTNNTTVDVSKWHIEKSTIQIYRISGFSAKEIKVILSGFAWGSVNYYLNINAKDTSGYVKSRYGNNIGATCKNSCMLPPFYNIEVYFGNSTKMNAMNLNSSTTEADYKYIQQYPQFIGYGSRSKVESTFYVYALADHDDFIELKLNSASYDADNNLMLSNGFTVEVYRLG